MSSSVKYVPLRELAVPRGLVGGPFGSKLVSADYVPAGVPVIRGQNLSGSGYFDSTSFVFVSERKVADDLQGNIARPGDVVFTQRGTLGQVGIVPSEPHSRYVVSQSQMRMRVDEAVAYPKYVYYCFRDPRMVDLLRSRAIVTGVPHINLAILADVPIPNRSLRDQQAIVDILSSLDCRISINDRLTATVLGLAEAKYSEQATVSEGWKSLKLADAARWLSGGTPRTSEPRYWGGDIPWISAVSLKSPWIDGSDRQVTRLGAENGTRLVPKGTIIFVVRGSSLDTEFRIGMAQREVAFGQDCRALIAVNGVDPTLLFVAVRSRSAQILGLVDHAGHGAGRLATDRISQLQVRLPHDSGETAMIRSLIDLGGARHRENRILASLRDTLLPELISGRIRIKDAERQVEEAT